MHHFLANFFFSFFFTTNSPHRGTLHCELRSLLHNDLRSWLHSELHRAPRHGALSNRLRLKKREKNT